MLRRRMGIKKARTPPPRKQILLITFVLFIICVFLSIWVVSQKIDPILMDIANAKRKEFATRAINQAVLYAETYDFDDMTTMDTSGDVTIVGWNGSVVNKINRVTTDRIEEFFKYMNQGVSPEQLESKMDLDYGDTTDELVVDDPTLVEIPLGEALGSSLLANLGPKIPINFEIIGSVDTQVKHEIEEYGINNSLVKLYIYTSADVQVIIPNVTKVETVTGQVYLDSRVIMGGVPEFYGGNGNGPSISVPKQDLQDD
ncbi:sporulation protein YunB [Virgibacillus halotolerans]|uniref:sporulation protein YunB n=1 Tax=Virgibacillus halotolerans TaxID=1071053 RepID=UPI0019612264|nr:sporulation protein YunB [Virgibacillus halotolerans]MBM7600674.1 sporulation protein YunB [Virgibacillus halotolerans]